MNYTGAIDLRPEERALLLRIELGPEVGDSDEHAANADAVPKLMALLRKREAIPAHRLAYFDDPAYRSGRLKGSYRSLFERNRTTGVEIFQHYSFRVHLRYFLFGADLPADVISQVRAFVECHEPISSDDVQDLWELAKSLSNQYRLEPHDNAEEFFKLCLDCGVHLMHAAHVRDVVAKMKLRKDR